MAKAVKSKYKKVQTTAPIYEGPTKIQIQSTGAILSFRRMERKNENENWLIFEYTYVSPTMIRGVAHENYSGSLGRELKLVKGDLDRMLKKEIAVRL